MITAMHAIIYSRDAEADRAFFRDVLKWDHADAGDGWPIFRLPPTELAVHPVDGDERHQLFMMCDDIETTVSELTERGVEFNGPVVDRGWGLLTELRLPGGSLFGIYEPRHPSPVA